MAANLLFGVGVVAPVAYLVAVAWYPQLPLPRIRTTAILLSSLGFALSIWAGFSVGRLIVVLPLVVGGWSITERLPAIVRAVGVVTALLVWVVGSFVLFGHVQLLTVLLVEWALVLIGQIVSAVLTRWQAARGSVVSP